MKMVRSTRDIVEEKVPTSTPVPQNVNEDEVPAGTVPEVLSWVGEDVERAQKALDAEVETEKPRKGLVASLTEMIDAEADEEAEESDESGSQDDNSEDE